MPADTPPSGPATAGPDDDVATPYWAELLDITAGDTSLARMLEGSLHRLASGRAGPLLAELADDVLHGRMRLRAAASSTMYGAALSDAVHHFQHWYDQLDPQQRAALTGEADPPLLDVNDRRQR